MLDKSVLLSEKNKKKNKQKMVEGTPVSGSFAYYGGGVIPSVEISTVFWGSGWSSQTTLIGKVNSFFTDLVHSSYITQLVEYSADGNPIGNGRFIKSISVAEHLNPNVSDLFIQAKILSWFGNRSLGPADMNTLVCVFVDLGTTVWMSDGSASGVDFIGYHNALQVGGTVINYMVVPMPSSGIVSDMGLSTVQDAITVISSHEFAESITDPGFNLGWYDMNNGEIGDICEGGYKNITVGSNTWKVQYVFSQVHQTCS